MMNVKSADDIKNIIKKADTDLFTSEDIDTVIESIIESKEEYSSEDNVCDSDDNNSSDSDSNSEQLLVEE